MTSTAQGNFQARMAQLTDVMEFVESFCERQHLGRGEMLRLRLVVEELFTNTVEHGHGGDSDAQVRLELGTTPDAVTLRFEDSGQPFDPLAHRGDLPEGPNGPIGGLGIHLVVQIASSVRYAREDGRNRLWITLRRAA